MKKPLITFIILFYCIHNIFSQGVGIGTNTPDPSARLEVSSNTQGILVPRMTAAQRNSIQNPANGLMIFNTSTNCFNVFLVNTWKQMCGECEFANPVVSNNGPVCEGDSLMLFASSINGATYQWTGPNGFTSSKQNPIYSNIPANANGTYSVVATVNNCASLPQSSPAIVHAKPSSPLASYNSVVCIGSTLSLSASNIIGASYAWSGPNSFSSNLQNPIISLNAQTTMNGTYQVTASQNGCVSSPRTIAVNVISVPSTPGVVSGPLAKCINDTSVLYSISPVTAATSYNWSVPASSSITSNNGTSIKLNFGNIAGNISVNASNACGSSASTSVFVSLDSTSSDFSFSGLLPNTPIAFSPSVVGALAYQWAFGGGTPSSSSNQNPVASWSSIGMYNISLNITGSNGCSSNTTKSVNISNAPLTQAFSYSGVEQTFVVPAGVYSVSIESWGAQGGSGNGSCSGGLGGYAKGTIAVVPGTTMFIYVGGQNGWNGGGVGGANSSGGPGGNGGGASDVRMGGNAINDRIIVAGGGGGSGALGAYSGQSCCGNGGDGGGGGGFGGGGGSTNGSNGNATQGGNGGSTGGICTGGNGGGGGGNGGGGGASGNGGNPGIGGLSANGIDGSNSNGGKAGSLAIGGNGSASYSNNYGNSGGGGGGWWGGGGGGCWGHAGGGGGGSSYTAALSNGSELAGQRSGDGYVLLTY